MFVEFGTITVYAVLHDWLPLGAAILGGYKVWYYMKNFKSDIQADVKAAKSEMLASNQSLEKAVNFQTSSLVSEFREMREDSRAVLSLLASAFSAAPPVLARAARAKSKKTKVDITAAL